MNELVEITTGTQPGWVEIKDGRSRQTGVTIIDDKPNEDSVLKHSQSY